MTRGRWFLPEAPDVLGLLRQQVGVTIEGIEAFAAWARGDPEAGERLRALDRRADQSKRKVVTALRAAFVTELEPEDLFALSRGVDWILKHAADVVSEAEALDFGPDAGIASMAELLGEAVREIDKAIARLGGDGDSATAAADAAIDCERRMEQDYYRGMAALLEVRDMRERVSRRELYRRCARIGETVIDVAERVVYAVMKQS